MMRSGTATTEKGRRGRGGGLRVPRPGAHVVQFYEDDAYLNDVVARYTSDGLAAGQPLLVIATEDRIQGVEDSLASRGIDPEENRRGGRIRLIDAEEALARFMVGEEPDEGLFRTLVMGEMEEVLEPSAGEWVRAYGEMVDVLWRRGNRDGAVQLEEFWNRLADVVPFSLLCAYDLSGFEREADSDLFRRICRCHTDVVPAESYTRLGEREDRHREISLLQQRARALEAEIERRRTLEEDLRGHLQERLRVEDALRGAKEEAERATQVKSKFLAMMSHELRTPVNAMLGYEELLDLEVKGPLTPEQRGYLRRIRRGGEQLLGVIDQILDLTRIEAGRVEVERERCDGATLWEETASLVEASAVAKGLELRVSTPAGRILLETDRGKVRQILLNLLSNAVKFTEHGGVELRTVREGEAIAFEVEDTGPGIDPGDLRRIFEPFEQVDGSVARRFEGTGLGLAVSRDLARLLGGEVEVESTPGKGSTFTLRLPTTGTGASADGTGGSTDGTGASSAGTGASADGTGASTDGTGASSPAPARGPP